MCGGFNVEVLENCKTEAGIDTIDDETRDASVERIPYRDETTVSDEEDLYQDETTVSDEGDPYRDETTVPDERDTYRDERTVSDERDTYQDETTVPDERDTYRDERTVSDERDTYRDEITVSDERDTYQDETTVPDESVLNQKSESADNGTPKKKRLHIILDINEYFSESSETDDMSQYAPILFPRKETTNDVTSSESSSDSEELEDVYGDIVFRRKERHKPKQKVDLLEMDPKSLPYKISNRLNKQSKFLTEDNIDKDILDENLERLRSILKTREAKLKKAKFSKHLVKEESEDYSHEIFYNGIPKNEFYIPNVQLKPCSIVLERLNISSVVLMSHKEDKETSNMEGKISKKLLAMLKPCSVVLERVDISTVALISYTKEICCNKRKRHKKQIAKSSEIAKKLQTNVLAVRNTRSSTRSSKNRNTRRSAVSKMH